MSNSITAPITIIQNTINAPVTLGIIGGGGGDLTSGPVRATNGVSSIANGALTIAMTSGLQTALDAKQATLTNYSTISALTGYPTSFPTTPADINNVGTSKLLGRHGAGTGTAQEIGIDGGLELHGGNLRRAALTGFIEASAGSGTTTLSASAASEGGNGAADAGKLVKFYAGGAIYAYEFNTGVPLISPGSYLGNSEVGVWSGAGYSFIKSLAEEDDLFDVFLPNKTGTVAFMSDIPDISTKQDTLVSGTNIKTVNGNSLLGSGDVTISGGFSGTTNRITVGGNADSNLETTIGTSGTNATVNTVRLAVPSGVGTTNVNLLLEAKGTGAIIAGPMPDGTATGGNARGANAIDLQTIRSAAIEVANGIRSIAIGSSCRSSAQQSVCIGDTSTATANQAIAIGQFNNATAQGAVAIGYQISSTALFSLSNGYHSVSDRYGMYSYSSGRFSANGDAQRCEFVLRIKTTNATPTEMALDGGSTRLTIPSGKIMSFVANITGIKSDGSAVAMFARKGAIKNVAGTTTLVGSIETIGTDIEDNAATDVSITANNASDFLSIQVTGIAAETWRWVAHVEAVEIAYGT